MQIDKSVRKRNEPRADSGSPIGCWETTLGDSDTILPFHVSQHWKEVPLIRDQRHNGLLARRRGNKVSCQ